MLFAPALAQQNKKRLLASKKRVDTNYWTSSGAEYGASIAGVGESTAARTLLRSARTRSRAPERSEGCPQKTYVMVE